jgi:hypothetical protein
MSLPESQDKRGQQEVPANTARETPSAVEGTMVIKEWQIVEETKAL